MFVWAAVAAGAIYVLDLTVVGPYLERAERLRLIMNDQATAPLVDLTRPVLTTVPTTDDVSEGP